MKEEKYPKDFQEFLAEFKDEESCRRYLFEMRWTDGFVWLTWKSWGVRIQS